MAAMKVKMIANASGLLLFDGGLGWSRLGKGRRGCCEALSLGRYPSTVEAWGCEQCVD